MLNAARGSVTLPSRIVVLGCVVDGTDGLVGSPALTGSHAGKGSITLSTVIVEIKTNPIPMDAVVQGMHSIPQHFIPHYITKSEYCVCGSRNSLFHGGQMNSFDAGKTLICFPLML